MLGLPFKETLDTYPTLDPIMRMVEQEDLREKGESFFEELMREIEIKNAIAGKVYQNKSLVVTSSVGETEITKYGEADPGRKTQKYLLWYNDISNRLYGQFEVITSMLGLPFKETLDTYPTLDPIMRMVEQEDLREKGESFFEELMREIEIKNAIAGKVYQNKSLVVTSSVGETEITKEYEEYKKESRRLMDFCRRMVDKRSKREEYEEREQPQGVPDVKPISKKELDEKIKEALIKPKEAQNIGEDTIPPQYSREMSRYQPPIPVKEKEKEDLIEKVREITNGESKGSKDEKQAEGETELSWDHEGLEPYPCPKKPKPQRSPKEKRTPTENGKREGALKEGPRGKESQEEERESPRRAKEKLTSPKLDETARKELEEGSNLKWGYPEKRNGVDKNTEQWVSDQNKFWERKGEKLGEIIPKVFEPQNPIKILQRGKQPQSELA